MYGFGKICDFEMRARGWRGPRKRFVVRVPSSGDSLEKKEERISPPSVLVNRPRRKIHARRGGKNVQRSSRRPQVHQLDPLPVERLQQLSSRRDHLQPVPPNLETKPLQILRVSNTNPRKSSSEVLKTASVHPNDPVSPREWRGEKTNARVEPKPPR